MVYQELQLLSIEDTASSLAQELERDSVLTPEEITALDVVPLPPLRTTPSRCLHIEIASTTFGVGKSEAGDTLAKLLTGPKIVHHPERWWDNPDLKNPQRRYYSELCFLRLKGEDNKRTQTYPPPTLVLQETPAESDFLFAATDRALGTLTEAEFLDYQQVYQSLFPNMVRPDLIVFLYCGKLEDPFGSNFEEIFRRIITRDRGPFELVQGTRIRAIDYLTKRFLREGGWGDSIPILAVNTGPLDFANDDGGKLELAQMVVQKTQEVAPAKFASLKVKEFPPQG